MRSSPSLFPLLSTDASTSLHYSSDFVDTTPDANYAWSTATASAVIPSSTALSSAAQGTGMTTSSSSRTSSSSSSTSSAVEIGVGVGVGVGGALILAFLAGWFLMKRRTRKRTDDGTELQSSNKDGRTPVQEWVSSSFGGDQHPQPAYGAFSSSFLSLSPSPSRLRPADDFLAHRPRRLPLPPLALRREPPRRYELDSPPVRGSGDSSFASDDDGRTRESANVP